MKQFFIFILFFSFFISWVQAFDDVENNWYKQSILELKDLWVVNGDDSGNYNPLDTTSRAELLKIIMNTAEREVYDTWVSCFSDVDTSAWFAKYICAWVDGGITKWYDNGTFQPSGTITVLETLAFGARAFDLDIQASSEDEPWYEKYILFADTHNIIKEHSYTLNTLVSRGQAAEIILRMKQFSEEESLTYMSEWCSVNPELTSGSYSLNINGVNRNYLLYVPSDMQEWKEMWLVVAFHGRTNSNEMVRDYMQLGGGRYGYKQNDFIVAYPAAAPSWPYSWSQYSHIEFFDAIITEVSENLCVDRDAVFSVGHSLGSYMSNKVSCQRGDVIRAMAWVASDWFRGDCTGPVASLITHLPGDHLAAYSWGERAYSIRSEVNLCSDATESTSIWDIRSCTQKISCTPGNTVLFCNSYTTYGNDPHSWPKDGSDDILDFFREIDEY